MVTEIGNNELPEERMELLSPEAVLGGEKQGILEKSVYVYIVIPCQFINERLIIIKTMMEKTRRGLLLYNQTFVL